MFHKITYKGIVTWTYASDIHNLIEAVNFLSSQVWK